MHTVSYEFLMKPEESAGCHQTLFLLGGGWARDYQTLSFVRGWGPRDETNVGLVVSSRLRTPAEENKSGVPSREVV